MPILSPTSSESSNSISTKSDNPSVVNLRDSQPPIGVSILNTSNDNLTITPFPVKVENFPNSPNDNTNDLENYDNEKHMTEIPSSLTNNGKNGFKNRLKQLKNRAQVHFHSRNTSNTPQPPPLIMNHEPFPRAERISGDLVIMEFPSRRITQKNRLWTYAKYCLMILISLFILINIIILHVRLSARIDEAQGDFLEDPTTPGPAPSTVPEWVQKLICSNMFNAYPPNDFPGCDYCLSISFPPYNVTSFCVLKSMAQQLSNQSSTSLPVLSNWFSTKNICSWQGVECDSQSWITTLTITFSGAVTFNIPSRFGMLVTLKKLSIIGDQQSTLSSLPSTLENLPLEEINLQNVVLSNTDGLENLRGLESMILKSTGLKGSLPNWISEMPTLKQLDLSFNEISSLEAINDLRNLLILNLTHNQLSSFPESLPKSLTTLDASQNEIQGALPDIFQNLPSLEYLNLENNQLDGTIPSSLGSLGSLQTILLSNNHISGSVPERWCQTRPLTCDLRNNKGIQPQSICQCQT